MNAMRRKPGWMVAAAVLVGCAGDRPDVQTVVRDSAGIRITENPGGLIAALPAWRLVEPPVMNLGVVEGDPAQQFNEIAGAYRMSDGRVVLADGGRGGSREIRFFDAEGNAVASVGGGGEGPGEFGRLHSLDRLAGDTLVASDWPVGTLSWFSPEGEFVERTRIGPYWPGLTGRVLPDGSLLTETYPRRSYGNEIEGWAAFGTEDRFRPSGHLLRVSRDGETVDTLTELVGEEWFRTGQIRVNLVVRPMPFARNAAIAWTAHAIYVADTYVNEIRQLSYGGEIQALIRWRATREPVTSTDRTAFEGRVLDGAPAGREADFRRWLAVVPYPRTKPAFAAIHADDGGRVWVQQIDAEGAAHSTWIVFEPGGQAIASVSGATGLTVHSITEDHLVASWLDDLEVPYLRVYRIQRG